MSELFPLRSRPGPVSVRLRCRACEVAWSGPPASPCWVCGAEGTPLHAMLSVRDQSMTAFDLDLMV